MNLNNHPGSITSFLKVVFAFLTPMNSLTSIRALSPSEIQKPNSQYVRLVFTIFFQTFESRSVCNFQTLHWLGVLHWIQNFGFDPNFIAYNPSEIHSFTHGACVWKSVHCGAGRAAGWVGCGRSCQLCTGPHRSSGLL